MVEELNAVVLRVTPYSDRHAIVATYSREMGRVSLLVPAGNSRGAARVRAMTMPLSLITCQVQLKPGQEILKVSQLAPLYVADNIIASPMRRLVAQFLAETLTVVLRESQADEAIFDYISQAVTLLDSGRDESVANFHLWFLYRLSALVGIEPDMSTYRDGYCFDMREGVFKPSQPLGSPFISSAEATTMASLSRMNADNMHVFRFNRNDRNAVLDAILGYYSIHYASLRSLRSLEVLRSLF